MTADSGARQMLERAAAAYAAAKGIPVDPLLEPAPDEEEATVVEPDGTELTYRTEPAAPRRPRPVVRDPSEGGPNRA